MAEIKKTRVKVRLEIPGQLPIEFETDALMIVAPVDDSDRIELLTKAAVRVITEGWTAPEAVH